MPRFLYTVWFLDPAADPADEDREWPACLLVEAPDARAAQARGDMLTGTVTPLKAITSMPPRMCTNTRTLTRRAARVTTVTETTVTETTDTATETTDIPTEMLTDITPLRTSVTSDGGRASTSPNGGAMSPPPPRANPRSSATVVRLSASWP